MTQDSSETLRRNRLLLKSLEKATELAVPLQPVPPAPARTPMAMGAAGMTGYAGIYQNAPDYLRLEPVVEGGMLFLMQAGQPGRSEVTKVDPNSFTAAGTEFLLIPAQTGKGVLTHIAAHALRKH